MSLNKFLIAIFKLKDKILLEIFQRNLEYLKNIPLSVLLTNNFHKFTNFYTTFYYENSNDKVIFLYKKD